MLDKAVCISFHADTMSKSMNSSLFPLALGKIVWQSGYFCLGKATGLKRKTLKLFLTEYMFQFTQV